MKLDTNTLTLLAIAGFLGWYFWPQLKTYVAPLVGWGKGLFTKKSSENINPLIDAWGRLYEDARAKGNVELQKQLKTLFPLILDGDTTPREV